MKSSSTTRTEYSFAGALISSPALSSPGGRHRRNPRYRGGVVTCWRDRLGLRRPQRQHGGEDRPVRVLNPHRPAALLADLADQGKADPPTSHHRRGFGAEATIKDPVGRVG